MKNWIIMLLLSICFTQSKAQKHTFDVIMLGDVVGEVVFNKTAKSNTDYTINYSFTADARVLFVRTVVDMKILLNYTQGILQNATVNYKRNNTILNRKYTKNTQGYLVETNGEKSQLLGEATLCIMDLYDAEPIGKQKVLGTKDAQWINLRSIGNHQYELKTGGSKYLLTYKNGLLEELLVKDFVNLTIKRKK